MQIQNLIKPWGRWGENLRGILLLTPDSSDKKKHINFNNISVISEKTQKLGEGFDQGLEFWLEDGGAAEMQQLVRSSLSFFKNIFW